MAAIWRPSGGQVAGKSKVLYAPAMARGSRHGIADPTETLGAMRVARKAMVVMLTKSKIGGPAYQKAQAVMDALDDLAEELTGDRDRLWKSDR